MGWATALRFLANPKVLGVIAVAIIVFSVVGIGKHMVNKLEETNQHLFKAEIERSVLEKKLESRNKSIEEIERILGDVKQIRQDIKNTIESQQEEFLKFSDKIDSIEFEVLVDENPLQAVQFVNDEFENRMSCIEDASGNVDAVCEDQQQ